MDTINLASITSLDELHTALLARRNTPPVLPATGELRIWPHRTHADSPLRPVVEHAAAAACGGWRVLLHRGAHQLHLPLHQLARRSDWSHVDLGDGLHLRRVPATLLQALQHWFDTPSMWAARTPLPSPDAVVDLGEPEGPWLDLLPTVVALAADMPLDSAVALARRLSD